MPSKAMTLGKRLGMLLTLWLSAGTPRVGYPENYAGCRKAVLWINSIAVKPTFCDES